MAAKAHERDKIERLCQYIARPALSSARLSLTDEGQVCYAFKTPWCDGTTHVVLEPLDCIARLAALIPRPGVNHTRYHGVFAPNSPLRAWVTPGRRGKRVAGSGLRTEAEKRRAIPKAQRLKRVFRIDIETCMHCGGTVKIVACIRDPVVVRRIFDHGERKHGSASGLSPQAPRAPPALIGSDGALDPDCCEYCGTTSPAGVGLPLRRVLRSFPLNPGRNSLQESHDGARTQVRFRRRLGGSALGRASRCRRPGRIPPHAPP